MLKIKAKDLRPIAHRVLKLLRLTPKAYSIEMSGNSAVLNHLSL